MFSSARLSPRRRWAALTAATVILQFAYWPVVVSLGTGDVDAAGLLWLGVAVSPFVFLALAFVSGHPRAPGAVGRAMGLFLLVVLPVGLANVVLGLVTGFGVAGAVALRREEGVHSLQARLVAVAGGGVYLLLLLVGSSTAPALGPFALVSGAVLPLAVLGIADEVTEGRADRDNAPVGGR